MKKLEFSIDINAPREKVWEALWEDANYRNWTSVFMQGSYYESDLTEGSAIRFLSPGENGMYGIVEKMVPFEKMYFQHKGEVLKGIEQEAAYGDEAIERYDLAEKEGVTTLTATLNTTEEFIQYFTGVFPEAMQKIKTLAEQHA